MPVSWTIGTSPNAELTNTMLRKAIATLSPDEKPIVHSDRGCHYRWPEWIKIMDDAGLTRSMSRKGCSPDNSACEGFFVNILVREYRCSGGTDTANPAPGNRCSRTEIPHLIVCYLRVYSLKAGSNPYTSRIDL